jgi:AcrR family transcriptional regulator
MTSTARPAPSSPRPPLDRAEKADKRDAILDAARRLIARSGLHNTPMSALAREAGVAAGTLYLYFPSKEAMINALYLELLDDQFRAATTSAPPGATPQQALWAAWHGLARWHLDHSEASNVIEQCRAAGILSAETREFERRDYEHALTMFEGAIAAGGLRDLSMTVFHALFVGPIVDLTRQRDAGEIDVTDALLRETFAGVCRAVLP